MARHRLTIDSRDWLDNKELRRCSPLARCVLMDMMCIASEGTPYGHVADKSGPIPVEILAARFCVQPAKMAAALKELVEHKRVLVSDSGSQYIPRMVRDEDIRRRRADGGKVSGAHPNVQKPKQAAMAEERKAAVVEAIVAKVETKLPPVELFMPGATRRVDPPSGTFMAGFEDWWALWSSVKGTHKKQQALQAWMSVLSDELLPACMECTASYLGSLRDPASGYNPDNFLYEMKKQKFGTKWPAARRTTARDTGAEIADLARERWDTEGKL